MKPYQNIQPNSVDRKSLQFLAWAWNQPLPFWTKSFQLIWFFHKCKCTHLSRPGL